MAEEAEIELRPWRHVVLLARFSNAFLRKGVMKSLGVLFPMMVMQLDTNYTTIGLIMSLNAALAQLSCPLMNALMKRFGTRVIAIFGGLGAGMSFICSSFVWSIPVFGFLFMCGGFCFASNNLGTAVTLRQYFGKKFGSMNSLALVGASVGSTVLPVVTAELLQVYGLRGSLLLLGGILLNEGPIGATLKPPKATHTSNKLLDEKCPTGENIDTLPDVEINGNKPETKNTRPACLRWLLILVEGFDLRILKEEQLFTFFMIPVLILASIVIYGWVLFVTSYAISVGIEPFHAALLATSGAMGGIASGAIQAIVLHIRPLWSPQLLSVFCVLAAFTLFIQTIITPSLPFLLGCSFIIGVGLYGISSTVDAVVAHLVSTKNFQGAIAITFAVEGIGTLIAGPLSGFLFDTTGSFVTVFRVLGGILLADLAIVCFLIITLKLKRSNGMDRKSDCSKPV